MGTSKLPGNRRKSDRPLGRGSYVWEREKGEKGGYLTPCPRVPFEHPEKKKGEGRIERREWVKQKNGGGMYILPLKGRLSKGKKTCPFLSGLSKQKKKKEEKTDRRWKLREAVLKRKGKKTVCTLLIEKKEAPRNQT